MVSRSKFVQYVYMYMLFRYCIDKVTLEIVC